MTTTTHRPAPTRRKSHTDRVPATRETLLKIYWIAGVMGVSGVAQLVHNVVLR